METIIETHDLCKRYGHKDVLVGVNLDVKEGDILGLVGKNGEGKTTLIRVLTDVARPTSGSYSLFGVSSPKELVKARKNIAAMVETPSFFGGMNAKKNLITRALLMGMNEDLNDLADHMLDFVGLSDEKNSNKKAKDFSLGMRQRLGIAMALMGDPKLLILDEPTNGLDPAGIVEIRELLLRLNREKGITIVISSHILGELSRLATRYCFLDKGKVVKEISAEELEHTSRHTLILGVDDTEKALALAKKHQWNASIEEGKLVLSDFGESASVMTSLIQGGIAISSMKEESGDLEAYFMDLLKEEEQ